MHSETTELPEQMFQRQHENERRAVLDRVMGRRPIPPAPPSRYMRPAEVAAVLRCSRWTVLRKLRSGTIPGAGEVDPGYWIIERATFERWVETRIRREPAAPMARGAAPTAPAAPQSITGPNVGLQNTPAAGAPRGQPKRTVRRRSTR